MSGNKKTAKPLTLTFTPFSMAPILISVFPQFLNDAGSSATQGANRETQQDFYYIHISRATQDERASPIPSKNPLTIAILRKNE
jgi:hypothetical protein